MKQNGFTFVGEKGETKSGSKDTTNKKEGTKQIFWVEKTNKDGRPFTFIVKVNEDEFELEIFNKTPRGTDGDPESGSHSEDSNGRDFTINSMYILLSNDNGPNKDLHDFHGGIHHLSAGKISSIGDLDSKLAEDPKRIMRYVRMLQDYGNPDKVSEEDKEVFMKKCPKYM